MVTGGPAPLYGFLPKVYASLYSPTARSQARSQLSGGYTPGGADRQRKGTGTDGRRFGVTRV
jgi:hypothetical protein